MILKTLLQISLTTTILFACGSSKESKKVDNSPKKDKVSFIKNVVERVGFPIKLVQYKICEESKAGGEDSLLKAFHKHELKIKKYNDDYASADDEGKKYLETKQIRVTSTKLIETCPRGAVASCEHKKLITYFYDTPTSVLITREKICKSFKNKWSTSP